MPETEVAAARARLIISGSLRRPERVRLRVLGSNAPTDDAEPVAPNLVVLSGFRRRLRDRRHRR